MYIAMYIHKSRGKWVYTYNYKQKFIWTSNLLILSLISETYELHNTCETTQA